MPAVNLGIPSVSHSRVESYLRCRRQNYYGYVQRLTRKTESDSLFYGKVSHSILDAFYSTFVGVKLHRNNRRKMYAQALENARQAMNQLEADGYVDPDGKVPLRVLLFDWYFPNEPFVLNGYQILESEAEYRLKIHDQLSYTFIVDLIVLDPRKRVAVVDHKNMYDFIGADEARLLPQIPKYIGALRALGKVWPEYGIYNQLRTRKIEGPKMNKAELVQALLTKLELGVDDHWEGKPLDKHLVPKLEELAAAQGIVTKTGPKLEQMLDRLPVEPSDRRVTRTFTEQIDVAEEILWVDSLEPKLQDDASWRTANKMVCQNCSYKSICAVELDEDPEEVEKVREAFYTQKEAREGVPLTDDDIDD